MKNIQNTIKLQKLSQPMASEPVKASGKACCYQVNFLSGKGLLKAWVDASIDGEHFSEMSEQVEVHPGGSVIIHLDSCAPKFVRLVVAPTNNDSEVEAFFCGIE